MNKGQLIVLSGPSGTGKGTVVSSLISMNIAELSVSCTTRLPRDGEKEGVNYFFKTADEFKNMIENSEFIEYAEVFGNYYGTPRAYVEHKLLQGHNVILEIDVQGAMNVKKSFPAAVLVFLLPPSLKELHRRLAGRGTETPEVIKRRFDKAKSEIELAYRYDYVIVNDEIQKAVDRIKSIIDVTALSPDYSEIINDLLKEEQNYDS